jgi:hypothetical protein
MRKTMIRALLFGLLLVSPALADTVILRDGASYSGQFNSAPTGEISFTDARGVQYKFPVHDVQSLVFSSTTDIVTLRNGKIYSGQYTGADALSFQDREGIQYQFPLKDVETLVLTQTSAASGASGAAAKIVPSGTEIVIRSDENIDSNDASTGQLFSATVSEDVPDSSGGIAIPRGTPAKLVIRNITTGGATHSPELVLDLFSVSVGGKEYRVVSSDADMSNNRGVGKNKRTLEYGAGGAGFGALMGAIFGGGKGAGIGAAAGLGGGLLTQILTRGKQVKVPAETLMHFRLDRTLVLKPRSGN